MRTLKQVIKKLMIAADKRSLTERFIISAIFIVLFIALLKTMDEPLTVGVLLAIGAIAQQLDTGAWEVADTPWMLGFFAWYTALYTTISALFI